MQKTRVRVAETIATLLHDNITNAIIITTAAIAFKIPFGTSLKLWILGQCCNLTMSYTRRYLFSKYNYEIEKVLNC